MGFGVPHDVTNFSSHDTANLKFQKFHKSLSNSINKFNVHGFVHRKNILIYIQQDATLHSYLETALHFSGGTSTHHQERKQLYLQHLHSGR